MTIAELKEFINRLPDTMDDYEVENAEYMGGDSEDVKYRLDKPVVAIYVREDTKELLLMNAPMEQYKNEGQMSKEYILIDSEKVAKIKYEALQKIARHSGEPLSEASIEARAVLQVVNYLYENNEWIDIHNRIKSDETGYQELRYTEFKIKDR